MTEPEIVPTPEAPAEDRRATPGPRIAGIAIDWAFSMVISSFFFPTAAYANVDGWERVAFGGQPLATLGIWAAQHFVFVALLGMTYGHRFLKLRVVREDGARFPGFKAAAIRTVLLALVIPAVVWDSEGRGLHDRAAGTRLISIR